ncbi:MAG TPA: PEP-CTERM sorting domain-containing protein [Verrucomicrobiota bacterium]|nr:PEP-CTERM sorting domain-containing protein [Verrucomicrobiota bacterium]HNU51455.1 PEP-CTERM sorting domain-containing protein [Verrucomicrobiota bacterium]
MKSTLGFLLEAALAAAVLVAPSAVAQVDYDLTRPGDQIIGVGAVKGDVTSVLSVVGTAGGVNNYPGGESPEKLLDDSLGTKYLNFAEVNVGFILTLPGDRAAANVTGFQLFSANDSANRDPMTLTLEGAIATDALAAAGGADWTLLYEGASGLTAGGPRYGIGDVMTFDNAQVFNTYRLLVTTIQDSGTANSMQFSEVQLYGTVVPEPGVVLLLGLGGLSLWIARRRS